MRSRQLQRSIINLRALSSELTVRQVGGLCQHLAQVRVRVRVRVCARTLAYEFWQVFVALNPRPETPEP